MGTILGLDLGGCKSMACVCDPATTEARTTTIHPDPTDLRALVGVQRPGRVVIQIRTGAGRGGDAFDELRLHPLIAGPMQEA